MKAIITLFLIVATLVSFAQNDSTKKLHISGIQLSSNMVGTSHRELSRENYQSFIKNNEILNADVTGYEHQQYSRVHNYSSYIALKLIADLRSKKSFPKVEFCLGFNFGESVLSSAYYIKQTYDTTGIYYNAVNNETLITVTENASTYYYHVRSQQLLLPLGINLTTKKSRWVWASAGLELSPGLVFSNVFSAQKGLNSTDLIFDKNTKVNNNSTYATSLRSSGKWETRETAFGGVGFACYANLPIAVNVRLGKQMRLLKHLSASASIAPGFYYSKNKFSGTNNNLIMNSSLGLRYTW